MNIATVLLTHADPVLTADTVDAVEMWVGDRVLVLVDEAGWPAFQDARLGSARVERGFHHAFHKSAYRNSALGLKRVYELWPDSDWYLYTEYDCLFLSGAFRAELERADRLNGWCAGFDLRRFPFEIPFLEVLLDRGPVAHSYFLIGCCMFLSRKFLGLLHESGFLDRLLSATQTFTRGYFPDYPRWAFEEELWPTAAVQFGGSVYELACWKPADREWQDRHIDDPRAIYNEGDDPRWRGPFPTYSVRFRPLMTAAEVTAGTSIAHPVKGRHDPIRVYERGRRDGLRGVRTGPL